MVVAREIYVSSTVMNINYHSHHSSCTINIFPFLKLKEQIHFSVALEFGCCVPRGLEPILMFITPCFLWNPMWFTSANTLTGEEIYQRSRSALYCTTDHNTMNYAGSKPKSQKKFVAHDHIIYSPCSPLCFLFLSQSSLYLSIFLVQLGRNASSFVFCDWGGRHRQVSTALGKRGNPATAGVSL